MKKARGGAGAPPRRPALDPDDAELWQRWSRSVEPLPHGKAKSRVRNSASPPAAPSPAPQPPSSPSRTPAEESAPAHRRPSAASPPATLERRRARRIASGRVEIDARLDLHGLRETEAFRRLQSFLIDACGRGLRTVLVITGKGRTRRRSDAADEPYTIEEPGVIRRNVPRWLAEPALAAFVVSFAPASVRHGGDGALYLYLRKSRRR